MNDKVSIIIINFNTPNLVYDCVRSIEKHLMIAHEIIVVDNGSKKELRIQDSELSKLLQVTHYSLLELERNVGFGKGNNAGAELATGEIIWFLNSDTLMVDASIEKTLNLVRNDKSVGIASPILFNDADCKNVQPDFYANFQNILSLLSRKARDEHDYSEEKNFETDVVVGASMILRKEVFEEVGGFDKNIFMFFDDDDLCYRIKKLGYKVIVNCEARIVHLQGKSISRNSERKKIYYRSQDYFWRKNYGLIPSLVMRIFRWPYKILKTI